MRFKTRLLTFSLAIILLFGFIAASASATAGDVPLRDVPPDIWFHDYVQTGLRHGFIQGTGGNSFHPDRIITRSEFVSILGRVHQALGGELLEEGIMPPYIDINPSFYIPYLAWASEMGIIYGDGQGRFRPYSPVTRQEMATILTRYIESFDLRPYLASRHNPIGRYEDWHLIAPWAYGAAHLLRDYNIMQGSRGVQNVPGVYFFRPTDVGFRREAVAIFARLFIAIYYDFPAQ